MPLTALLGSKRLPAHLVNGVTVAAGSGSWRICRRCASCSRAAALDRQEAKTGLQAADTTLQISLSLDQTKAAAIDDRRA